MFKAQKGSQDIVKMVHVSFSGSTLILWSYEDTFCAQNKKQY